jgi:hypothetical protein
MCNPIRNKLVLTMLLASCTPIPVLPPSVATPSPMIDSSSYSFAIDINTNRKSVEIARVEIVQGSARSYESHPSQFQVSAKGDKESELMKLVTYDPLWQRIFHPLPDKRDRYNIPDSAGTQMATENQANLKYSPGDPPTAKQEFRESWFRRDSSHDRYFLPFSAEVQTIDAGYVDGIRSVPINVEQLVSDFCSKNSEYCYRRIKK